MADTAAALDQLAEEFWAWRSVTAPDSSDDLPRLDRPPGWLPDWSLTAVTERREVLAGFYARYRDLDFDRESLAVRVDARLLGCALDRAHWELDLLRGWRRNPCFYIDQSLVPVYNLLLVSTPFTSQRAADVVRLLQHVPTVLGQARENLEGEAIAPFAVSALRKMDGAAGRLRTAMAALVPVLPRSWASELPAATEAAATALDGYQRWLRDQLPEFGPVVAEPQVLSFLLHRVALVPYPMRRLREHARREWARASALEQTLRQRHGGQTESPRTEDVADLVDRERAAEEWIRGFYVERNLLSQPATLRHYRFVPRPAYLESLTWLGVCDDLTSPARITEDAVRYVARHGRELPYFEQAAALDPRTAIVHEGVHAQQLALSWEHPRLARRHFYDSIPNEGVAFYNEEMMLVAGAFDDSPTGALFVANAMRLRALRVELDIALAVGELTVEEAADRLARLVPMDNQTAWDEAVFFVGCPGQGLSYQTGKLQVHELLATAAQRDDFDLREFHDRIWREGNVPFALQRWEAYGDRDHLDAADQLGEDVGVGNPG